MNPFWFYLDGECYAYVDEFLKIDWQELLRNFEKKLGIECFNDEVKETKEKDVRGYI